MQTKIVNDFIQALDHDFVCLHPTDTLPGLSFHPNSKLAKDKLYKIKGREQGKTMISLVASLEQAQSFWEPLPKAWNLTLKKLWPSKLTVIWKASQNTPKSLVSSKGYLALRYPKLEPNLNWMYEVIKKFSYPLPSTSVNQSGEKSITPWDEALKFCETNDIFIPELKQTLQFSKEPSTIILLEQDSFKTLREGALKTSLIEETLRTLI